MDFSINSPPRRPDRNRRIAARAVRDLCGGISDMTLWRWLNDPEKDFPRPAMIGKRRYWREAEILEWLDAQADKLTEIEKARAEAQARLDHADALEAEGEQKGGAA